MSITREDFSISHLGNGAQTVFSWPFNIPDSDSLVVTLVDEDGNETALTPSEYSATGFGAEGSGQVTISPAPEDGVTVLIKRTLDYTLNAQLNNQGAQYPETLQRLFERLAMMIQQVGGSPEFNLRFPLTDVNPITVLPAAASRANKYFTFDGDGNPSIATLIDPGLVVISALMEDVLALGTEAAVRAALGIGVTGTMGQGGANTLLGNPTGSTANPQYAALSEYMKAFGNTRGMTLRRGASVWEALALGGDGTVFTSDGTDAGWAAPPMGEGMFRNLAITASADTAVSVAADWITLANASNKVKLVRGVNVSINTGSAGAGGLDTGTMASNTWYAVWLIYNQTTDTVAAMLSLSGTSPTLPSGYTFRHRVGWVRTQSGSANLYRTRQRGAKAQYVVAGSIAAPTLSNGTITVVGDHVPTTAVGIHVQGANGALASLVSIRANSSVSAVFGNVYAETSSNGANNPVYNDDCAGNSAWFLLEGNSIVVSLSGSAWANVYGWEDSI